MKRYVSLTVVLACIMLFYTGCTNEPNDYNSNDNMESQTENPFEQLGKTTQMARIGHSIANPNIDSDGKLIPFEFNGEEMSIDYNVITEGKAKNIGFLLFIDGVAQPYRTEYDSENKYLQTFNLKEDNVEEKITFKFMPVTGKSGETLPLTVMSVYYPDFKPDMKETISYGMFHSILQAEYKIKFTKDTPEEKVVDFPKFTKILRHEYESMGNDFIEKKLKPMTEITLEKFNKNVYNLIYFDGKEVFGGNYSYSDEKIDIEYILCGIPGAKYKTTFYLNHEPISECYETVLEKGKLSIINAQLDTALFSGADTFYIISVPLNAQEFKEENFFSQKTSSVLLYREK